EVVPEADLAVSLRASPGPARVGGRLTYTLVMTNSGPTLDSAPILVDSLPISATLASVTPSQGSCNSGVACDIGALPSGAHVTVTLVVTLTAAGLLKSTAQASGSEFNPNLANNQASVTVQVLHTSWLPLTRR